MNLNEDEFIDFKHNYKIFKKERKPIIVIEQEPNTIWENRTSGTMRIEPI